MKLLHLPLTVPGSEQVGQEKGFRRVFGNDNYRQFDFLPLEGEIGKHATNEMLKSVVADFQPNIIWAQIQETSTITPETWQEIRRVFPSLWITMWSGDARDYVPETLKQIYPYFDVFYNDTDQVEMYLPFLGNCQYKFMPIAVDPDEGTDFSHPTPPRVPEIIFIGGNYGHFSNSPFRFEVMKALSKEFGDQFGVFGHGWPQNEVNWLGSCPVKHQGAYYHQAKVVISVDHIQGILHWSERLIWAMMSGTPVVMEDQRGLATQDTIYPFVSVFEQGNINDCIQKVRDLLSDPFRATAAQSAAVTYHAWEERAKQVKEDYVNRTA